VKIWLR